MVNLLDIMDRALEGPFTYENDFDLNIFYPKLKEVIHKYDIQYDPDNPLSCDDALADSVFKAGIELFTDMGVYCVDTERIIRFTEEEILEGLAEAPSHPVFGEGNDAKALVARRPESDIAPWCFLGAGGAAVSNETLFESIVEAYASFLPLANSITTPTIKHIEGRIVRTKSPLEILACIRSSTLARSALRKGGRAGLPIMNSIASAVSDTAKIAGSQFGLRPTDGWLIGTIAEMKINYERLNEITYVTNLGGNIVAESAPILGGYCGGPEGVAVTNVAYHLNSILLMKGSCQLTFPIHYNHGCTSVRDILWANSVSAQAISRNSHFPFFILNYVAAGPMTEMCLYETAATVINAVVSGASIEFGGVAKAVAVDHFTPMEPKWASEIAHGVIGMSRSQGNEIVTQLLARYEDDIPNAPKGKTYEQCWDMKTKQPIQEYLQLYQRIKAELAELGVGFKY
ncbi:monomethylamine:corrinoid methyltransferase [Pseudomonadota bacterium]